MKKFTLYVGLNDKDTKKRKVATKKAREIVQNVLLGNVDGYTISEAEGLYRHESGEITIEKTMRIELLFVEKEQVKAIVGALKKQLNQESVAVQEETIISELW